jgi:ribosome biogenesis GTPase
MWEHVRAGKTLRQIRKDNKRAPREDRVRRKDWLSQYGEDSDSLDEVDLPDSERVMPRGERERRRTNLALAMSDITTQAGDAVAAGPRHAAIEERGTVVEISTGLCRVNLLRGDALLCQVRRSLKAGDTGFTNVVAVGDEVVVSSDGDGRGMVEAVLPRRSALARPDPFYGHLRQVIVANVDQLLIVASWREPALWPELIDRYLISAARNRLAPIICINKMDLAANPDEPAFGLRPWIVAGYRVIFTSATTGQGVADLRGVLMGRTTALAGLSGVGKSSLLAAVQPGLNLRVAEVSDRRHEGRHTTTQVTLHPLAGGGFVVDTPGIREFGLSGLNRRDLAGFYPEMIPLAGKCQFADCSHTREPGCAVRAAVREGRLAAVRYENYRKIYRDLPE